MVETSLELECQNCGKKFWYSGRKEYPETVDCSNCGTGVTIPEDA